MCKKITLFLFITLFGLQLLVQNSETLIQKIFELRQSFIIEKSASFKTLTLSKKEWFSYKNTKEIKIANNYFDIKKVTFIGKVVHLMVIEDHNENFIKFITHSLKNEKSKKGKTKLKRNLVFTINFEDGYSNLKQQNFQENNFYSHQKKYLSSTKKTLKPPIYLNSTII
jgi:hypothetical protein